MLRRILIACGWLLTLAVLLIIAFLIGVGVGARGSLDQHQTIEEAKQAKRWIEREVKEELLRLQKVKERIEQEPQEVQEQKQPEAVEKQP